MKRVPKSGWKMILLSSLLLLPSADVFFNVNFLFLTKSFGNTIKVSNGLDPDLGPNCLQMLLAET